MEARFASHVHPQDTGVFNQKIQSKTMQEAMATDPSMMVDMLKKSVSGMVPQVMLALSFLYLCSASTASPWLI